MKWTAGLGTVVLGGIVSLAALAYAGEKPGKLVSIAPDGSRRECSLTWEKVEGNLTLSVVDCPGLHNQLNAPPRCSAPDDECSTNADCLEIGENLVCGDTCECIEVPNPTPTPRPNGDRCAANLTDPLTESPAGNWVAETVQLGKGEIKSWCVSIPEEAYEMTATIANHCSTSNGLKELTLKSFDLTKYPEAAASATNGEPRARLTQLGGLECGYRPPGSCTGRVPGGQYEIRVTGMSDQCTSARFGVKYSK